MNLDKENFANPSPDDLLSPKVISDDRMNRLVGKALWRCTRAADLVAFQFGERRETRNAFGTPALVGEYALHVQCAWRITRDDQVLVGNVVYYSTPIGTESDLNRFDWDHMANRRDELIRELFIGERTEFPIIRVDVGQAYNLRIITESICLEIFPITLPAKNIGAFFDPTPKRNIWLQEVRGRIAAKFGAGRWPT